MLLRCLTTDALVASAPRGAAGHECVARAALTSHALAAALPGSEWALIASVFKCSQCLECKMLLFYKISRAQMESRLQLQGVGRFCSFASVLHAASLA